MTQKEYVDVVMTNMDAAAQATLDAIKSGPRDGSGWCGADVATLQALADAFGDIAHQAECYGDAPTAYFKMSSVCQQAAAMIESQAKTIK